MARVFNTDGLGSSTKDSSARTCTVRVNGVDPTCAFLDDKIQVGTGMTKSVVPGPSGLALLLESSGGGGGGSEGYDSILPNPLLIETYDRYVDGADGEWGINYDGLSVHSRQGMMTLSALGGMEGHTVRYLSTMSKVIDQNRDVTKDGYISFATMLHQSGPNTQEGTYYVTLGYMNTGGIFTVVQLGNGFIVHETIGDVVEVHVIKVVFPLDMNPHTPVMLNVIPYDSAASPPEPGNVRAMSWYCTPLTLYIPVLNYPLVDGQFLTS